jgi:hypothetical protein
MDDIPCPYGSVYPYLTFINFYMLVFGVIINKGPGPGLGVLLPRHRVWVWVWVTVMKVRVRVYMGG